LRRTDFDCGTLDERQAASAFSKPKLHNQNIQLYANSASDLDTHGT